MQCFEVLNIYLSVALLENRSSRPFSRLLVQARPRNHLLAVLLTGSRLPAMVVDVFVDYKASNNEFCMSGLACVSATSS